LPGPYKKGLQREGKKKKSLRLKYCLLAGQKTLISQHRLWRSCRLNHNQDEEGEEEEEGTEKGAKK